MPDEKFDIPGGPEPGTFAPAEAASSTIAIAPLPERPAPKTAKMVPITIDGTTIEVEEGSPLFDACKKLGILLPAMCYHYSFSPFGSCGICLVEVEGKSNNVRSCTAKVTPNMVIRTDTPKMIEARKAAVEKWLVIHPLDCPVCDADGKCELQDMTYELGVYDIKKGKRKQVPEDIRSPGLDFNMERCILCGQCINVCKEVQMIDALAFYKKDGLTHVGAHGGAPLFCEFCGDCLAVCPVGAIVSKFSKYTFKPWQLKKTETTCTYCSDGCAITLESEPGKITRVTSSLSYRTKFGLEVKPGEGHGGICVRGRFGFQLVASPDRLSRPRMHRPRADGGTELAEIPWLAAIPTAARRLLEIKTAHGPDAIAGLISARCTNEEIYLFQKFFRCVLGSNQIDSTPRYGLMNAVAAMREALGARPGFLNSFVDIALADTILIVGSDITETHPVMSLRVKEALSLRGAKVVVIDPIRTKMAALSQHVAILPGSEGAGLQALTKAVLEKGWTHARSAAPAAGALQALSEAAGTRAWEELARATGVSKERWEQIAGILASGSRTIILFGEGILSHRPGYAAVENVIDLGLALGLFFRPGCGINPIAEENNEVGAVEMGGVTEFFPGPVSVDDPAARERFSKIWNEPLALGRSGRLPEILERARRGEIKALYIVGENPVATLPKSFGAEEALAKIEFVIVQDPFLTETAELAHLVLPACTFAEKEGTFTSVEGKVNRVAPAIDPKGEAKPDWRIFVEISKKMNRPLAYKSVEEIRKEIGTAIPGYYRNLPSGADASKISQEYLARIASRYRIPIVEENNSQYPYRLVLGQIIYHSGKMTTRDSALLSIDPKGELLFPADDARRLAVSSGDIVRLVSPSGRVEVPIEVSDRLPAGLLFWPEHFTEIPVKDLLAATVDPVTAVPYFKSGPVGVEVTQRKMMAAALAQEAAP